LVTSELVLFAIALPIVFVVVIICLNYQLLFLLRKNHPEKWRELGSPTLVMNNSIKNNLAVLKFLNNQEYLGLKDHKLTKISRLLWNLSRIYLVLLVIVIFLFLINLIGDRRA